MRTLKHILTLVLFIGFSSIQAQEKGQSAEKNQLLDELKRDYIVERLELSEEQSKKFLQLMEEFEAKKKAMKEELGKNRKEHESKRQHAEEDLKNLSEADAKKILETRLIQREKFLKLEREYMDAAIAAISAKKVIAYHHAEKEFHRELLKMLKDGENEHHMREKMMRERKRREMGEKRERPHPSK